VTYLRISGGVAGHVDRAGLDRRIKSLRTRTPLVVAASASALNVVLNLILVYGAGLGIAGSALGTVLAQSCAAAAYLRVVVRGARGYAGRLRA
jgi:Na+-driven multidrug efflux pump